MSTNGMISARKVLETLTDDVWLAAITTVGDNAGVKDFKINLGQFKAFVFAELDKNDVGLGEVDNTSDQDKPISVAVGVALEERVLKEELPVNVHDILAALGAQITLEGDLILDEGEHADLNTVR